MILDDLAKSRKLPPGHYDKAKAEERVKAEYAECLKLERKLAKGLPYWLEAQTAANLAVTICHRLGSRPIKHIQFSSEVIHEEAAGEYHYDRTIHVHQAPQYGISIKILLHELSHHISAVEGIPGVHKDGFLWVEEMVFGLAREILKQWRVM